MLNAANKIADAFMSFFMINAGLQMASVAV